MKPSFTVILVTIDVMVAIRRLQVRSPKPNNGNRDRRYSCEMESIAFWKSMSRIKR